METGFARHDWQSYVAIADNLLSETDFGVRRALEENVGTCFLSSTISHRFYCCVLSRLMNSLLQPEVI